MNKVINGIIFFTIGAATGSAVTFKVIKDKYAEYANQEIEAVRIRYQKEAEDEKERRMASDVNRNKPDLMADYGAAFVDRGPTVPVREEKKVEEPVEEEKEEVEGPVIIAPNELGDIEDYKIIELTYYDDDILAEGNDICDEKWINNHLGSTDVLDSFGQYEDDSVYIRNDDLGCYYEILRSEDTYYNV